MNEIVIDDCDDVDVTPTEAQKILEDPIRYANELEKWRQAVLSRLSPAGSLGLPPLLDQRRLDYGIIDSAFKIAAVYDRIYVWQIDDTEEETYGKDSQIVRPDNIKARDRESAPRGILIAAGLRAMDILYGNGIWLGHILSFQYLAPYRRPIERIDGKSQWIVVLNAGDISGSEDLRQLVRSGRLEVRQNEKGDHCYYDTVENKRWDPRQPWTPADY